MLIQGRKLNQRLLMGDNISILIVEIQENKVRLGFRAPGRGIWRPEVHGFLGKPGSYGPGMLVLSRECGEEVQIDGGIKITVLNLYPKEVKLGIEAPTCIPIYRLRQHHELERRRALAASRRLPPGLPRFEHNRNQHNPC